LRDGVYTRDWVNTTAFFSLNMYFSKIIERIASYINTIPDGNYYIIGEGFPGVTLSSALGYKLQKPFTYVIPDKDSRYHTIEEKKIEIPEESNVIIITDVIIFGNSMKSVLDGLKENYKISEKNILKIITVFFRRSSDYSRKEFEIPENLSSKVICLNNAFPAEICCKDTCIFHTCNLIEHEFENKNL